MTPYERVFNRLEGKPVDKVPNLSILMTFAAKYINTSYDRFCKDYKLLVEANIKCNEAFGIDMLSTMSDPYREAYDFGAKIEFPFDELPKCKENLIKEISDCKILKRFDPYNSVRMLDRIRAIELYKTEAGNHYPVLGWVEGAFAEAADLRGINDVMLDIYDEPDFLKELLIICNEQAIVCAKTQIQAGADFIGIGDAAASLVSPAIYKEFVLPLEQKLIEEIHNAGAKAKLHICGNIMHILDKMPESMADIIDIDWMVDFRSGIDKFKGHCSANGNFDPVSVVLNGSPEDIRKAVGTCLKASDEHTFISPGCEVPRETPYENLKAIDCALKAYSQ